MDLIERVESYKVLFKECKALEPVSTALAKGYKSATPLQRLEIIRELDTELAEVYSVEIPVITAWVRDDNYVHSTKEIFLGEPSLEGFLHQFRHHLQNKAREPQYKYLLVEDDPKADYRIPYKYASLKLSIGAYNVYNQSNPSFVYFKAEQTANNHTKFIPKSKVMLPFIPYISFKIKL